MALRARVSWAEDRTFIGRSGSSHSVIMDVDSGSGGHDAGVRPLEMLLLGMGVAPAAALLFAAAAGGPVTFWGLARIMPLRSTAGFIALTWLVGVVGGLIVLLAALSFPGLDWGFRPTSDAAEYRAAERTEGPLWKALEQGASPQ